MKTDTKLFFVVDSTTDNEELHETLEQARRHRDTLDVENNPRIYIAMVKGAYKEPNDKWNYTDTSETFEIIRTLELK